MAKSLKQKNQPQLITFVVLNVMGLGAIALGVPHLLSLVEGFTTGNWAILGKLIAVPAALTVVTGILGWAMPRSGKEVLVFWKTGKHGLPSSRAFTDVGPRDPRVDMKRLNLRHGSLPLSASEQTALWYRIYRSHEDDASVEDAHGAYLRFREMTTLAFALLLSNLAISVWFNVPSKTVAIGCALLIFEYLFVMLAARHAATHFVSNVLAIESAGSVGANPS
jgi:hypothetical protein